MGNQIKATFIFAGAGLRKRPLNTQRLTGCSCFFGSERFSQNIAALLHCDQVIHLRRLLARLFGRQRGDDFLKARIAAQRVPEGQQF